MSFTIQLLTAVECQRDLNFSFRTKNKQARSQKEIIYKYGDILITNSRFLYIRRKGRRGEEEKDIDNIGSADCLLPTAYCQLPTANCLLPTAYYLLPTTYYLLPTTYYLLPTFSTYRPATITHLFWASIH